jgi:hypothetical protein
MAPSDGSVLPSTDPPLGLGHRTSWQADPELPVAGAVELGMSVERLWSVFSRVRSWPEWNPCMWTATVSGGRTLAESGPLAQGRQLIWAFNPIRPYLLYRLPVIARLVEVVPRRRVSWEVTVIPGMWALHTYWMEPIGDDRCRFGSWEVAEGPVYRVLRTFWQAHFTFVRDASLEGARRLASSPNAGQPSSGVSSRGRS